MGDALISATPGSAGMTEGDSDTPESLQAGWMEARERGESTDIGALCDGNPQHAVALRPGRSSVLRLTPSQEYVSANDTFVESET